LSKKAKKKTKKQRRPVGGPFFNGKKSGFDSQAKDKKRRPIAGACDN
jgi:hypothetical protein